MTEHESERRELVTGAVSLSKHVVAIVAGVILMFAGLGMGVTLVLLPIGIPVGLAGLLAFLWGLFGHSRSQT